MLPSNLTPYGTPRVKRGTVGLLLTEGPAAQLKRRADAVRAAFAREKFRAVASDVESRTPRLDAARAALHEARYGRDPAGHGGGGERLVRGLGVQPARSASVPSKPWPEFCQPDEGEAEQMARLLVWHAREGKPRSIAECRRLQINFADPACRAWAELAVDLDFANVRKRMYGPMGSSR